MADALGHASQVHLCTQTLRVTQKLLSASNLCFSSTVSTLKVDVILCQFKLFTLKVDDCEKSFRLVTIKKVQTL